jgi:flagellar biosynthesis/type III secretory pathway ATPase
MNEPVADTVRGTLDGHIVLSRALAHENHYPAIDILASVSRLMIDLASAEHQKAAAILRELLAVYRANEDLINIGAYVAGSNPRVDLAIKMYPKIQRFLRQEIQDCFRLEQTVELLQNLVAEVEEGVL